MVLRSTGRMNDDGLRVLELCSSLSLCVTNTHFFKASELKVLGCIHHLNVGIN